MAIELNARDPFVPGPRGALWRDTAIRGHRNRGSGILNNETYVGRIVFNRRNFRKNPETEQREARLNDQSEWVVSEVPELRIVDDGLWAKVKKRQLEVGASFVHTATNRLNRSHRPKYLFSGLLECGICGGPYSVIANARFGCKNRSKHLPIEHLVREVCPNSRTISRAELERRVLDAIPARLLSVESTASIQDEINKQLQAAGKASERQKEKLEADLRDVIKRQDVVAAQVMERVMNGQPQIEAFNKMLDELQKQRDTIQADLSRSKGKRRGPPKTFIINPSMYAAAIAALTTVARSGNTEDDAVAQHFNFIRELVQKVVIVPSADGKAAELTIIGRLASILASMQAFQEYSAGIRQKNHDEFVSRVKSGGFANLHEVHPDFGPARAGIFRG